MLCSPAVTTMNVKPRFAHTLDSATDDERRARVVAAGPGFLTTGIRSWIQPMLASTPT